MKSTVETRQMAQDVLAYIEAHPEKHDQRFFLAGSPENTCGTTMCVAGTAAWLKYGKDVDNVDIEEEAIALLGLSEGEAQVLFFEMDNARALDKLQKVAAGKSFNAKDYERSSGGLCDKPVLDLGAWEKRDVYNGLVDLVSQ